MSFSNSSSPPAPLPPLHILLVDDELCVRHIFGELLRGDGHTVGVAASGEEALEKFRDEPWDVVLTDRAMPGMGGEELAVPDQTAAPDLPVIMITGFAPKTHDPKAIDAVLTKPCSRQDNLRRDLALPRRATSAAAEAERKAA